MSCCKGQYSNNFAEVKSVTKFGPPLPHRQLSAVERRPPMCNDTMPVSVKVYYGQPTSSTVEIRRFMFRPEPQKPRPGSVSSVYQALIERIRSLFNGLPWQDVHLCWKDDDGDYVVFSSDDELRVAISNTKDNTLRIYIRERTLPRKAVNGSAPSGTVSGVDYRRVDQNQAQRRYHRRSARSASASRDSDLSSPGNGRWHSSTSSKETVGSANWHANEGQRKECEFTAVRVDSGTSTSSGVIEESSDTMKETSNDECNAAQSRLCTECRGEAHRGVLYQCTVCREFYLCSICENRGLHDQHIMLRIRAENGHVPSTDALSK